MLVERSGGAAPGGGFLGGGPGAGGGCTIESPMIFIGGQLLVNDG